jgi:hypothetical protein
MSEGRVPLPLLQTPPRPLAARPGELVTSEPMLRFQCNQKGCCCQGWTIPLQLEDFVRLHQALPEEERQGLASGMEVVVSNNDAAALEEADEQAAVAAWADPTLGAEAAAKAALAGAAEARAIRAALGQPEPEGSFNTLSPAPAPEQPGPPVAVPLADPSMAPPSPAAAAGAHHTLHSIRLGMVGPNEACRFLSQGGGCDIHARFGLWALPDLCVDFPSFGYKLPGQDAVEMWWDPICPEVIRQLDESDAPLTLHRTGPDSKLFDDTALALRVNNATELLKAHVRGGAVSRPELEHLRAESLRALAVPGRTAHVALSAVMSGFQRLQPGRVHEFRAEEPKDPLPFLAFLGGCVGAHGAPILIWALRNYRRFIHAVDVSPVLDDPQTGAFFGHALEQWGPCIDASVGPREELIRPLALRWLGHRFGMPYINQTGDLRAAADIVAMMYGTSLRYAAALASALQRDLDRPLYQVAIGASEYFYRSFTFQRESLPWFASAETYRAALNRVTSAE